MTSYTDTFRNPAVSPFTGIDVQNDQGIHLEDSQVAFNSASACCLSNAVKVSQIDIPEYSE